MARDSYQEHNFYCIRCGNKGIPLSRNRGHQHGRFHRKKLYCMTCKEEVNHAEVRPFIMTYTEEDFKEEFELGRFQDGQRCPINELCCCSNSECPFNKNGRCWNANNSAQCKHKPE